MTGPARHQWVWLALPLLLALLPVRARAATLYVDGKSGCSDSYTHAQAQNLATPWCTLGRAAALVNAGDTVRVRAGTYTLSSTLYLNRAGTASQPITFTADGNGHVSIVGPTTSGAQGIVVTAPYNMVEGFEISGSNETGLRSNASYVTFRGNRVHDNGRGCSTSTKCGQGIASNSSTNVGNVIDRNVSYHNGSGTSLDHCYYISGQSAVVRNNVAWDCAGYGFQIYPDCDNCDVYNNVAYGMKARSGFVLGGEVGSGTVSTKMRVYNNIAAGNAAYGFYLYNNGTGGIELVANLAFGNTKGASGVTDAGTVYTETGTVKADPLLVDPTHFNWHLQAKSPAIDQGSAVLFAAMDIDGEARPIGALPDIGVDEYSPAATDGAPGDSGRTDGQRDGRGPGLERTPTAHDGPVAGREAGPGADGAGLAEPGGCGCVVGHVMRRSSTAGPLAAQGLGPCLVLAFLVLGLGLRGSRRRG